MEPDAITERAVFAAYARDGVEQVLTEGERLHDALFVRNHPAQQMAIPLVAPRHSRNCSLLNSTGLRNDLLNSLLGLRGDAT